MSGKRKPIASFSLYGSGVKIAVWPGEKGSTSFSIKKSVKNKDTGEWKDYESFWASDLAAIMTLIPRAIAAGDKFSRNKSNNDSDQAQTETASFDPLGDDDDIPF